jgi:hypothetical protein
MALQLLALLLRVVCCAKLCEYVPQGSDTTHGMCESTNNVQRWHLLRCEVHCNQAG